MNSLFKSLIGRFTGMTEPYPEGRFFGQTLDKVGRVEDVGETLKRANELTEKYGASVLFLDEIEKAGQEIPMTENEWTTDWPTEPGWYWFYGHKYGDERVSVGVVQVRKISTGVSLVLDGNFMFLQEKHRGVFQRIATPVVPAEIAGGKL